MADSIPKHESSNTLFSFFTEVGIISQLSSAMFESTLPEDLNQSQFSVLNWFTRVDDEATPGRLAIAFQVTPGAMTNTLKKLETKGLIKIRPDANSGRRKIVTMTTSGRKMRERAIASAAPMFKEFAEAFPPEKIARQLKALEPIRKYLDDYRFRETDSKNN